ncbi:MAG: branched-chain amino acid ABC transporter permease [Desulfobacula sp.]|jgi:branched-chain amino acid transport system permease protein|uniref:branched-chain amino acid ABC transporter permease n=1 Tax=Desulfobacula sp. TaxID=2593537 RepID=UPI001DAB2B77|nr:branched-chain amino acid ABC transporter permease [Desulfobacula sp.]MBT3485303.1 branched-chain amino acid ABC transporter permease [Desulfobacula sp.]MBT3803637.1 branched-chain amino acid ABC transporter permease [Desulfobacula sp.]MBT4024212.1 branched-chain amino acid ABC transporter permease [Desulfobacula sp.]MBT4199312.1 branched-chain amino acid ABC transporter permease [Desulfobacula sp.]
MSRYNIRVAVSFGMMFLLLLMVGLGQSWSLCLSIVNLCLISAIMAMGVNIQWGYAGLFNVGIMGFTALGGLSAVLISKESIKEAVNAGGLKMLLAILIFSLAIALGLYIHRKFKSKGLVVVVLLAGYFITRYFYLDASQSIEAINPAFSGYLGGLELPVILSWIVGGFLAAGAAWLIGKISLGLRTDYLAIATLGISEIIIAIIKNEDWLSRGVKNVTGIPRPVPYEIDLQQADWFNELVSKFYAGSLDLLPVSEQAIALRDYLSDASIVFVKLCYSGLFLAVLLLIIILASLALNSPWGRMVRAIRDNEVAASAMGKNVTQRHLQIFVIGSAIAGVSGAMLATYNGQFTPGSYIPLRYTFLIWVMVIVGGSGNNLGSVVGGFLIWFLWIEAEPVGFWLADLSTSFLEKDNYLRQHLLNNAQYIRLIFMGAVLLVVMRFSPDGILPETNKKL